MKRILLAEATGYLGVYIAKELLKRSYPVSVLARNPGKLKQNGIDIAEIFEAEITQSDSIKGCCKDGDVVISSVGITRQKKGGSICSVMES
jgi:putative NADH-flavin reductase